MFVAPNTDRLPHEPLRVRASTGRFALQVLRRAFRVALTGALTFCLWPLFLLGAAIWGWPPHQARPAEWVRFLGLALSAKPPPPGLAPLSRVWLALRVAVVAVETPLHGLAWSFDELLYGRQLRATPVVAPLVVLSAARSGSTQLTRYLEQDPRLIAPSVVQSFFPYLWLWKFASRYLVRLMPPEKLRAKMEADATIEFRQRHEIDPLRADTLEAMFIGRRLQMLGPLFGPQALIDELNFTGGAAHNRGFWEEDFPAWLDRLGRKALIFAGAERTPGARLFIKGHFLAAREALARRYPDGRFVTIIRDPVGRIASMVNHLHANPFDEALGAVPWAWLAEAIGPMEVTYCEMEQAWFTAASGPVRHVIRFKDFVADLEGTMGTLYREVLGAPGVPDEVPTRHAPRDRTAYIVDRSLAELGIDAEALGARLAAYRAWCRSRS